MPLPEYPYDPSTGKLMVQDFESIDNVRADKMYANEIHVTDIYGTNLYGVGLPTNYGLVTTMTAGVAAAGRVVFGAGTGAIVAGKWVALAAAVNVDETADANTKYPYLKASAPYLSATAPTYDAAIGYWTDGAGGRWLGAVFTKSAAETFRAVSCWGDGAGRVVARYGVDLNLTSGARVAATTVVLSAAAYAVENAIRRVALGIRNDLSAAGRHAYRIDSGTVGGGNVLTLHTWEIYTTGSLNYFPVIETDTPTANMSAINTLAIGAASYVRLRRVVHQF